MVASLASSCPLISRDMLPGHHYKTNFSFLYCAGTSLWESKLNSKLDSRVSLSCQKTPIWINFWRFLHQHAKSDMCVSRFGGGGLLHQMVPAQFLTDTVFCTWCCLSTSSPLPRIYCMVEMKVVPISHWLASNPMSPWVGKEHFRWCLLLSAVSIIHVRLS